MEKKEPVKISLPLFITIIVLLVAIISGIYVFMQNQKLDEEIANLKNDISKSQTEKNELQEKINNLSVVEVNKNTDSTEESNTNNTKSEAKEEIKTNDNQFSTYQENFEKTYKSVISANTNEHNRAEQFVRIPSHGVIRVEKNGDAYYGENESLNDASNKIDTNVASAHYCSVGQDSGDIVLIHRDGTVSVIKDVLYPDTKIKTKKIEKAKNIVSVIPIFKYDDIDGGDTYYLVDINGNIINVN